MSLEDKSLQSVPGRDVDHVKPAELKMNIEQNNYCEKVNIVKPR